MLQEFLNYLQKAVGAIYVLGAQGQHGDQITENWIKMREHYKASNYSRAIAAWEKKIAKGYKDIHAYDCSGLGMNWLIANGVFTKDLNANGMYGQCVKIKRSEVKKGDWVFRGSALKKTHIGYVVDDALNVVEAKGRDDGVISRHIDADPGYWKYFARPKRFKDEIEAVAPVEPGKDRYIYNGSGLNIRQTASILKRPIGFIKRGNIIDKLGENGKWWNIRLGSITGWCKPNTKKFKKV